MHDEHRRFKYDQSIKNIFQKSLLISYISFGRPYWSQDILSSISKRNNVRNAIQKEENIIKKASQIDTTLETALFEYRNEISGLKIIHRLNLLRYVEDQDFVN
ncbi:hypothetical protein DMUE_1390 [Dictyocoela muelleri]|nr:hypothetical protein DMUE_1390 [Dictyocoela muelleri]